MTIDFKGAYPQSAQSVIKPDDGSQDGGDWAHGDLAPRAIKPVGQTAADDIVLCAVNTGALYQCHLEMARLKLPLDAWLIHVRDTVIPSYRRDVREPGMIVSERVMAQVAVDLHDYYAQHLAEF